MDVAAAKRKHEAVLQCLIIDCMADKLPELLADAGSDPGNIPLDLEERLGRFRTSLSTAATKGRQGIVITQAMKKRPDLFPDAKHAAFIAQYAGSVQKAADAALLQYDTHMAATLKQHAQRIRLDPRREPAEDIPVADGEQLDAEAARSFFGMLPEEVGLDIIADWDKYKELWPKLVPSLKAKPAAEFWDDPTLTREVPQLAGMGRWYANMPTSNIAAERAFGIMRGMEGPQRYALGEDGMREELMARVNGWVVERMLARAERELK